MKIICREVCKDTGRISVYSLKMEPTGENLFCLRLRARANPELRYFVVRLDVWENETRRAEIESVLRRRSVSPIKVKSLFGVLEL